MNILERKKRHFDILKKKIDKNIKADAADRHQVSILEKKARTRKLISAGLIFEEAGILDIYDHAAVLKALENLKNESGV